MDIIIEQEKLRIFICSKHIMDLFTKSHILFITSIYLVYYIVNDTIILKNNNRKLKSF